MDSQQPVLTVIQSDKDIAVQGKVTVRVRASDDQELSTVKFSLDGDTYWPLRLDEETGLYEAVVDSSSMPGGSNSITFSATDGAGNTVQDTTILMVDNPPRLSFINPIGPSIVQGALNLQVRASDDLKLAEVEYAVDGGAFAPLTVGDKTGWYETFINTLTLSAGGHSIHVRAKDAAGNTTEAQMSIKVAHVPGIGGGGGGGGGGGRLPIITDPIPFFQDEDDDDSAPVVSMAFS